MAARLHEAVRRGDLDEVQRLVQTPGIEVDAVYIDGTPLRLAAKFNELDIARVLIAAGANVNWSAARGKTPLQTAALDGHKEMVMLLLQAGADINSSSNSIFGSPLAQACMRGHLEVARLLIERGADVNIFSPLVWVLHHDDVELPQALLDAGANPDGNVNAGNYPHDGPLHVAAVYGRRECVRALLTANADPNLEISNGRTALNFALRSLCGAKPGIISDLLSYGASVMHRNKAGRTALQELSVQYRRRQVKGNRDYCQVASILVAAGDHNWDCVPVPCPGIERALLSVWKDAAEELPEVVKRLDEGVQRVLQATLYLINNRLPVDLRMKVLGEVLLE